VALAWGSTLITGVAYFSAQSPSPLVFFYLWIFLYSAYFFTTAEMTAQILYVGVAYGALLAARPPLGGIPAWWLVGMGTLLVAAILIRSLRERVEALIASLYDAARTDPLTKLSNRSARAGPRARSRCWWATWTISAKSTTARASAWAMQRCSVWRACSRKGSARSMLWREWAASSSR
jgi:hypothetical protein